MWPVCVTLCRWAVRVFQRATCDTRHSILRTSPRICDFPIAAAVQGRIVSMCVHSYSVWVYSTYKHVYLKSNWILHKLVAKQYIWRKKCFNWFEVSTTIPMRWAMRTFKCLFIAKLLKSIISLSWNNNVINSMLYHIRGSVMFAMILDL